MSLILFLQRFETSKKVEPHFVQSAPVLGQPCVKANLELECLNIEEIQDRAFMCIILFTGMRNKDIHSVKSKNVAFVPGIDSKCPRHIDFKLNASKNDRSGQGSRANLTYSLRKLLYHIEIYDLLFSVFSVACICLQNLVGKAKGSFANLQV